MNQGIATPAALVDCLVLLRWVYGDPPGIDDESQQIRTRLARAERLVLHHLARQMFYEGRGKR